MTSRITRKVAFANSAHLWNCREKRFSELETESTESSADGVPGSLDWHDVTKRISRGDMDAFGIYYDHLFGTMFREVNRIVKVDENTALDFVQDAMLKAGRCMKPLRDHQSVIAWSIVVVKSVVYDWLRRQRRQAAVLNSYADVEVQEVDECDASNEARLELQAREMWLAEQLSEMPKDLQQLADLRYRLGWTLERIGKQVGLRPGCVDGRLRRMIERLRALSIEHDANESW
ncbi:MAG TPA: sigma-70 family RNA polymerase sigma factor [Pirellulaceae bacterium]|nr:sigma-70 family RNA polymerase sigma factor [Pirellulaceae bacterium]HMO90594.1 sigma-70 family RNA polymerase sigma factor [Pirellulaceae bacterium]HMP67827.1 sigma-70 family RNA polymerase sigma factor [Pirellulaceae bacterium]